MSEFLDKDNIPDLLAELNRVQQPTILAVDDVPVNLKVIKLAFANEPYNIVTALSAKEAWSFLKHTHPDLILLDVEMPEVNGFELCEAIRKAPRLSDIPIIFLTAKTEKEQVVSGLELGAVDYICKPFDREELLARVRATLRLNAKK